MRRFLTKTANILTGFITGGILFVSLSTQALPLGERLRGLPVQADGRIKPFDTFATEKLEVVYGKSKFEGRPAHEIILTWMLTPSAWREKELFEVRNHEILKELQLPTERRHFKGVEIFGNDHFNLLRQKLKDKRESKEKLTPYFQALERLENQFFVFSEIATGRMMMVSPQPNSDAWMSVAELTGDLQDSFRQLSSQFVQYLGAVADKAEGSTFEEKAKALDEAVENFEALVKQKNPNSYANEQKISAELHYNRIHPFRWASIFYLLAAVFVLFAWVTGKSTMPLAWAFVVLGFGLHTYGFGLRVYLTERPPVSNMYETVVWVAWGGVVFAAILEMIYRFRFILLAGSLAGSVALIVADSVSVVLDSSLQPLVPVLRSNTWLIVHVMTITISYAAFFLAFILGDIGLAYYSRGEEKHGEKIKAIVFSIYRAKQIGVAFLAPGIILGGVWADYSWGRFWGWDPKETWALIALLGYIAVLHGRLVGWIKDFGMVVSAVLTFSLVIMAWYGVNFILGAGLHSYGFGAGGVEYVSAFVLAHFLWIVYVTVLRRERLSKKS